MQVNDLAKWIDELQANISVIKQQLAAISGSVADVPDFNITTPTAGQILSYDAENSEFVNVDLPEIPTFDVDTPEDGQFLIYDGSDSTWKNMAIEFGGFSVTPLINAPVTAAAQVELSADVDDFDAILIEVAGGAGIHVMNTIPAGVFVESYPYTTSASSANVYMYVDSSSYTQFKMGEADNKIYFFNLRNVTISNIYGIHY